MSAVGLAATTSIAGIFGMNLVSGIEETPLAFAPVPLGSGLVGAADVLQRPTIAALSLNVANGTSGLLPSLDRRIDGARHTVAVATMGLLYTALSTFAPHFPRGQGKYCF